MDARSAREWSSEAADRAICPNSLRLRCCISEETGSWLVCDRTDMCAVAYIYMGREEYALRPVNRYLTTFSLLQPDPPPRGTCPPADDRW